MHTILQSQQEDWDSDCVHRLFLGADTIEYSIYYRDYPRTLSALVSTRSPRGLVLRLGGEPRKRPLYAPVSATLNVLLAETTGLQYPRTMYLILALYASLSTLLMFLLLRLLGLSLPSAVFLAAIVAISFGWLSVFSVPESYSLSAIGLMVSMISGELLLDAPSERIWPRAMLHSLVSGLAALLYPPNGGAVLLLLGRSEKPAKLLPILAACVALVALVIVLPQLYLYRELSWGPSYAMRWGSLQSLYSIATWANVLGAIFLFSIVSPVNDFMQSTGAVDWHAFFLRPGAVLVAFFILGLCAIVLRAIITSPTRHRLRGAAVWLVLLTAWSVFFNSGEALLYLSVPLGVLAYIAASGIRELELVKTRRPVVHAAMLITFLMLLATNWHPVFG